jgi:hypothetical protein
LVRNLHGLTTSRIIPTFRNCRQPTRVLTPASKSSKRITRCWTRCWTPLPRRPIG